MSEELNGDTRILKAKLSDGSSATFKVQWQGYADFAWNESGKAATWDHPFDDRRCHWSSTGRIVRSVAVVIVGQDYWRDDLTVAFTAAKANAGSSFVLTDLKPENCGDCAGRRDSDFADMRKMVNDALAGTIAADLPNVIASLKALPEVIQLDGG